MTATNFVEVAKVMNGVFVDPLPHIKRVASTTLDFFSEPLSLQLTNDMIPVDLRTGLVKCRIVYDRKVLSINFESYNIRNIKSLALIEENTIDYSYKYLNRVSINKLLALRVNCDDILIVKNTLVTDTSYTNVVFKDFEGRLYTPASTLLAGTKRQKLLDAGNIHEKEIHVNDFRLYVGVYLINAMIDIEDGLFVCIDSIL